MFSFLYYLFIPLLYLIFFLLHLNSLYFIYIFLPDIIIRFISDSYKCFVTSYKVLLFSFHFYTHVGSQKRYYITVTVCLWSYPYTGTKIYCQFYLLYLFHKPEQIRIEKETSQEEMFLYVEDDIYVIFNVKILLLLLVNLMIFIIICLAFFQHFLLIIWRLNQLSRTNLY